MRLTRDLRFSQDKTPYRTELSGLFWESSGEKTASPAFGFRLRADGMDLMTGMFAFPPVALARFRTAVADPDTGEVLAQLAEFLQAQPGYTLQGEQYQRGPSGYDASHPHATLLRYKGLYVTPPPLGIDTVCSDQPVDTCIAQFQVMVPLYQWLVDVLNSAAPGADD